MNLYSQLEKIVKIQPSHDAIEWESGVISYLEFYRLANSIAFSLNKKFKLKHGHKVALVMENSFIFLPILFGIWKAGLVAVPINAKLHKKELSWIFNNSEAKLVFCSKSKAPDIETNLPVIVTFSKDFKVHTQHEHQINIKTVSKKDELKIFGKGLINADNKKIYVPNLGDHRICMSSFILSILTGAKARINNFETVYTSSPSFLKIMKKLGAKFEIQK